MLLCFLSVTFWQCQKEDLYENLPTPQNKELKVQLLKGSDAQKISNRFKKEIHAFKNKSFGHEPGVASREENEFTIDYSQVLEVSDTLGNTNYTFRVSVNPEVGERTLFNFVINNRENQNKTFLLEYEMSEAFSLDYFNKRKTFDQFQGLLKIINIGSEGSNPCEDVIVEFNPPEPGGNQGVTYPTNPSENPNPTITIPGTTGGDNIGVIIIGGGSGGGGSGGGGGSNPSVSNGDNPSDGCDASLEEILDCISNNRIWNQVECKCSRSPRYFRFGNTTVIENMPDPCDGVIGAVGVLEENTMPCDDLISKSANSLFNSTLNDLKQKASTQNFESAHAIYQNASLGLQIGDEFTGDPNGDDNGRQVSLTLNSSVTSTPTNCIGFIHCHLDDGSTFKVFSVSDIIAFSKIAVHSTRPKNEFTMIVTTSSGTFALKINDIIKFRNNSDYLALTQRSLELDFKENVKKNMSVDLQKKGFLKFINNIKGVDDLGIDMFENINGTWNKLTLSNDGSITINTPCN